MDGVAELFGVLDPLVRRRAPGNSRPPSLLFQGPGADAVLRLYRERLITDGRETVPHVIVDCAQGNPAAEPADDPALFDELANGLSQAMPGAAKGMPKGMRGLWGLRLPRYWRVRQVLDVTTTARTRAGRRRELRDALYARRGELGAPAGWLDAVVAWLERFSIGSVSAAALATPAVGASKALFAARLVLARRLRWFGSEVARATGTRHDFLDSALCLVAGGSQRDNDTLVRRVLMLALVLDLQAATRRSVVSPFRRRRATAFVLHLAHVPPQSPAQRALVTLGSIEPDAVRRHTILVLASLAPDCDVRTVVAAPDVPPCDLREAAERLRPLVERGSPAERGDTPEWTDIVIDVPSTDLTEQDRQWLDLNRKVDPMPVAGAVAVPVAVWAVLLGAVVVLFGILWPGDPRCPDLDERAGETIGVGDGTADCTFFGQQAGGPQSDIQQAMAGVERAIAEENAEVLATGDPYSSIVFFAPLTVPDEPEREGENALNQLRGTALAQQRANDRARGNRNRMLTRVVLANPGDRFGHGVDVARRIAERAGEDDTIIGVVGIGQSRTASRDAVRLLGGEGLPVVAGPVTGDAMIDSSAHYYQVSPRNLRVASMLVTFSTTSEIVRTDDGDMVTADGAVIVMDHSDQYSENLARDIHDAFVDTGRAEIDVISYPVEDADLPLSDQPSDEPAATRVGSLDDLANQVCASLDERDVVFFASRSQQFAGMVESMHDDNDCPDTYTVVGGSALTKIVEDPSSPLPDYEGVDLYYAAFASQDYGDTRWTEELLRLYHRAYGDGDDDDVAAADVSDAALAYDAFNALQATANYARRNHYPVSADTSAEALGGGEVEFDGASGHIALGNGPLGSERQRVPADKPVLVLPAPWLQSDAVLACGRFEQDDTAHDTWSPQRRPCPSVD